MKNWWRKVEWRGADLSEKVKKKNFFFFPKTIFFFFFFFFSFKSSFQKRKEKGWEFGGVDIKYPEKGQKGIGSAEQATAEKLVEHTSVWGRPRGTTHTGATP